MFQSFQLLPIGPPERVLVDPSGIEIGVAAPLGAHLELTGESLNGLSNRLIAIGRWPQFRQRHQELGSDLVAPALHGKFGHDAGLGIRNAALAQSRDEPARGQA